MYKLSVVGNKAWVFCLVKVYLRVLKLYYTVYKPKKENRHSSLDCRKSRLLDFIVSDEEIVFWRITFETF